MSQATELNDGAIDVQRVVQLLQRHAMGMWRFRWIALAIAWGLSVVGWIGVYMLPDRYEASAQVFVDTDSVLRPLLRGLSVETDVMNDVAVMTRTLLTRPHLERVAREADLDLGANSPREFDAVLGSLERRIKISASGANIYTISFEDKKRDAAVQVVDKLLDSFVEDTLGSGQEDSQQAEKTLKKELDDYERRLTESEDRLKEFKRQNVGVMPNEHGDYYAQLQAASVDLAAVQQSIRVANEKAASLARQLEGEEPVFGIMSSPTGNSRGSSTDGQISALEQRRAELLIGFTEKHPDVVRIDQQLAELRAKRQAELASKSADDLPVVTNPLDINPVYQSLKIQRSRVEVELASLRAELADKQAKVDRLKKMVDVIPQVEAELNRLNRDYDVVKARYAQMLQRWEDLQTGKRVKSGTDQGQFRIINPPFAPLDPAGPPRAMFLVAAFVVSLGVGVGVAFLMNLLRPVFHQSRDLVEYGYPVLGSITINRSNELRVRTRGANVLLASGAVALLMCLGAVIVLASPGSRILRALV
ncbi:MAG TPA: XrtA system polysaccharide chain length determinant [Candidatus Acidoferrales bacterium]|nr:XrtA system polysaccharide chain length determinant [Candidatus Acidoferrales bacterium]